MARRTLWSFNPGHFDVLFDHSSVRGVGLQPELVRALAIKPRRPTADNALNGRVRLYGHQSSNFWPSDFFERLQHFANGHGQRR
jgi:hypothetical protein